MMRELDHRIKNTLALVLSISHRTAASEDTLEGFQDAFSARIQALAATHNLLAETSWADLVLRDLAVGELAPFVSPGSNRIHLENLNIRSEEHTSELQSLMRISYAVFCLKKKTNQ